MVPLLPLRVRAVVLVLAQTVVAPLMDPFTDTESTATVAILLLAVHAPFTNTAR